jgi:GTP-binding protein
MPQEIRNVAIIAHVDHGKTTLVDALLKQSQSVSEKVSAQSDLLMDSNDLERERGITIFSKNAAVEWKDVKINIIDTPGHADFGGEVERVLSMADGALLLVDAKEGPMPQTRFVLKKALAMNQKIIVVVNKVDKPDAAPQEAVNRTFDLFVELGADDRALDFPIVYASAIQGKAGLEEEIESMTNISPILDAILEHVPAPDGDVDAPLQIRVTSIGSDPFKGRIATGRIHNGRVTAAQTVMHLSRDGHQTKLKLTALLAARGLNREDVTEAQAGDIISVAGITDVQIGDTIADAENPIALPVIAIDEPTVRMTFMVNTSPFAGKEGEFSTSRQIQERLMKELETDMALRVEPSGAGEWLISGRGELHLAILIERLRREGYEFQVSKPTVITKVVDGKTHVPFDRVSIETPDEFSGAVIQKLGGRRGQLQEMRTLNGITFLEYVIPTRGLFGYRSYLLTDTKGLGIMNSSFEGYFPDPGDWVERENGSLVAHEAGDTTLYGLTKAQDRGVLFLGPGVKVYKGQVVGSNARKDDLAVHVCRAKQLTNMRSSGADIAEHFRVPKTMDLEAALEYIVDDELVEVTPQTIRIRKKDLNIR